MPKLLVDCDAFFASCEQARNPRLSGKKVLVAGDTERRSVVAAASYEARACGARAGLPIQEARRLVPDGIFLVGDFDLYIDFNLKLFRKLRTYNRPVELYSVDEFFVDFEGSYDDAAAMAREFKDWVQGELRITVSIGVAPTKIFAKLAAEMQKPNGLTVLRPEDIPARIQDLPVGKLFGVGPRTEAFLRSRGVRTIGDLRAYEPLLLEAELGIRGRWLHAAARGEEDDLVKVVPDPYKSMGNEMTLPEDTDDPETVRAFLCYLADMVAQRLRADGSMARTVHLHVRYEDFTGFARSKTMARPMVLAEHLLEGVNYLLVRHHRDPSRKIRLLGIGVSNLVRSQGYQLSLFPAERKALALARALDRIKEVYGQEAIGRASTYKARTERTLVPFAVVPGTGRRPKP
ncbi:MAG: Y-family DNA polymerase [Bacteroidota bacterium]